MYLLAMNHGGVGEHADLRFRTILVAQKDGVVDDFCKMRMTGRFTVACKGEYIRQLTLCRHALQGLLQLGSHLFTCRTGQGRAMVGIEATLAIDAVEAAHLTVGRHEVDAK